MTNTIERALEKQRQLEAQKVENEEPSEAAAITPEQITHPPKAPLTPEPPQTVVTPAAEVPVSAPADVINIDIERLEALGMVTPTEKFTQIKEEYRYIKRPLLNNAFGDKAEALKNSNLIMVTSSFPGEGKTFTAINLAISIALEQDRKVLLVDADVINPNVCIRLGIEERNGLMDYLRGDTDVNEIIRDTSIANLKLVTAGGRSHHSNELLASEKMRAFMIELATRYNDRIVVFDTSPVLGASETSVLSQMIGQAVLVVEEERTTHGQLERALSLLDKHTAVGLVLNKSKKSRREYYGYYYASSK